MNSQVQNRSNHRSWGYSSTGSLPRNGSGNGRTPRSTTLRPTSSLKLGWPTKSLIDVPHITSYTTNMIEIIKLNRYFTLEVISNEIYPDCDIYFSNGSGYQCCSDNVTIDLDQAKQIIAALTKFVEAKEKK